MSSSLKNNWRNLWVFGDSYSTPYECVDPQDSFWGLAAQFLQVSTVKNYSRRGLSFQAICQLLIDQQHLYDWNQDFFIIGVPPVQRFLGNASDENAEFVAQEFDTDWNLTSHVIAEHQGLKSYHGWELPRDVAINRSSELIEVNTLREIFFLTQWLDSQSANYVLINLSCDINRFNPSPAAQHLLPYCIKHSNCILFDRTYYGINLNINPPADFDTYGWQGHHGATGNHYFFEQSLKPRIQELVHV